MRKRAILLMEGADPLRTPADLLPWYDAGLRVVGLGVEADSFCRRGPVIRGRSPLRVLNS